MIGGRKWLAGGGEWCRYLRRSAEPSMLRTPPLRAPARVSPIPGALQYRADRPRAGHLGAFLPPARRDRVPRALLIR
ncbi:putative acetate permease [Burkholderia mallei]|nr:putative acetate permease [Burkholderia mallei]